MRIGDDVWVGSNAFVLKGEKRYASGLTFLTSYVFSTLDFASADEVDRAVASARAAFKAASRSSHITPRWASRSEIHGPFGR